MTTAHYPVNTAGSMAFISAVAACSFVSLIPFCHPGDFILPGIVAVLAAIGVEWARRNVIRKLVRRLESASAGLQLDVVVNGARVGNLSQAALIHLKLDALRDPRNYAAQLQNVIGFAIRCAAVSLVLTPIVLFWACAISASTSPASLQAAVSAIAHLQPGDMPHAATMIIVLAQSVFILVIGASFTFGCDLGFANIFRSDVHRRVRCFVNCASVGTVSLHLSSAISGAADAVRHEEQ